jgi:hypothetical protein
MVHLQERKNNSRVMIEINKATIIELKMELERLTSAPADKDRALQINKEINELETENSILNEFTNLN